MVANNAMQILFSERQVPQVEGREGAKAAREARQVHQDLHRREEDGGHEAGPATREAEEVARHADARVDQIRSKRESDQFLVAAATSPQQLRLGRRPPRRRRRDLSSLPPLSSGWFLAL